MDLREVSGFLLVDKPAGWTSFDVVAKLRAVTNIKKIGHAGTLDPFATGLLIVAVGKEATKKIDNFVKNDKVYEATFLLGATSDTHDTEGHIIKNDCKLPTKSEIGKVIEAFTGELEQVPPMHSAIKVDGKKLYELARKGKTIEREPRKINVKRFDVASYAPPRLSVIIECSSGTYIRALARDIGEKLGCGAYVESLRRVNIGKMKVEDAAPIQSITKANFVSLLKTGSSA